MSWIETIQNAIDYMEAHLAEPLTPEAVGSAIHYAPSTFLGLFRSVTGYTTGEYIRLRRLSRAAEDLLAGRCSVTEAAMSYGYATPEAFSKAFRRTYGCTPSQIPRHPSSFRRFHPIRIQLSVHGGYDMKRNLIPHLARVDWSDPQRQNEFVWSVLSCLGALGEHHAYDALCALSGSAFRTSFSRSGWNPGNYHVVNAPETIAHTFRMLGHEVTLRRAGAYEDDRQWVMAHIDRGVPLVSLEGVIRCADACLVSGYDLDGQVLMGYSPFMDVPEDHDESPDESGYFRKSDWHRLPDAETEPLSLLAVSEAVNRLPEARMLRETLALAVRLIREPCLVPSQHNGLAAHHAYAAALVDREWTDPFEPCLNMLCSNKQYLDKQYAVPFLENHHLPRLAAPYCRIAALHRDMCAIIPQTFDSLPLMADRARLRAFAEGIEAIAKEESLFADAAEAHLAAMAE